MTTAVAPKKRRKRIEIKEYAPPEVTFIDKVVDGKATILDLDPHIDMWHLGEEATNLLHEFLGLTFVDYKKLLSKPDDENLQEIATRYKKKKEKKKSK